jgi:hypothetical protein
MLAQDPALRDECEAVRAPRWRNLWLHKDGHAAPGRFTYATEAEGARAASECRIAQRRKGRPYRTSTGRRYYDHEVSAVLQLPMDAP